MKRAPSLAVRLLAAIVCLSIPWPAAAQDVSPFFHEQVQWTAQRLFPEAAPLDASSLQALRVLQAGPEDAVEGPAARFLAAALKDSPQALSARLDAAGIPVAARARIEAAAAAARAKAAADPDFAAALRRADRPIAVYRESRSRGLVRLIRAAALSWRPKQAAAFAYASAAGADFAAQAHYYRQVEASGAAPALSRLQPFSASAKGAAGYEPASNKVGELRSLAKTDGEKAFAAAQKILTDESETREPVKSAALEVVSAQPTDKASGAVVDVLRRDANWFIKWTAANWLGARAGELGTQRESAVAALREARQSSFPSVRIAAGAALEKLGVDPGPELKPRLDFTGAPPSRVSLQAQPGWRQRLRQFLPFLLMLGLLAAPPPSRWFGHHQPPAQTQTQTTEAPKREPLPATASETEKDLRVLADNSTKDELRKEAADKKAAENKVQWGSLLLNMLPLALLLGAPLLFMMFQKKQMGQAMTFGKSRARYERPNVTFKDVAGNDDAMRQLRQAVEYLKHPEDFAEVGAQPRKGLLLVGPPGTGKTLIARAVAGEAGVPFFSLSGSDFVEMFVGVGASRVRDLFAQAKAVAPAVIFIDEIDAVGRGRGKGMGNSHDEREQTLNQLLVELDGFSKRTGVLLIAATNRPDILDEALTRPGRFDKRINVTTPDRLGREAILTHHLAQIPLEPDVDVKLAVKRTPGFSGAALAGLDNEAALRAALRGAKRVSNADLQEAASVIAFGGDEEHRYMDEESRKRTAVHEWGHTLAGILAGGRTAPKVTIVPRGQSGGHTEIAQEGEDGADKSYETQEDYEQALVMAMGGRAAEELYYGGKKGVSSGPRGDIKMATKIARDMIAALGMGSLGIIDAEGDTNAFGVSNTSPITQARVDKEVTKLLGEALAKAKALMGDPANVGKFNAGIDALYKAWTLYEEEIDAIARGSGGQTKGQGVGNATRPK